MLEVCSAVESDCQSVEPGCRRHSSLIDYLGTPRARPEPQAPNTQSHEVDSMARAKQSLCHNGALPNLEPLARLRAYTPPPTQYCNCPLSRRAAVLILLFPGRHGELKVVLTMRSASLRNYAGQAALPGGKADSLSETPWETARREAYEEIGLPLDNEKLKGFNLEHLCELPANLARTELGVRPCVAYLSPTSAPPDSSATSSSAADSEVEDRLIPRLDPKEVAAVFTAPFHAFLRKDWSGPGPAPVQKNGKPEKWYRGSWTDWHESRWRMHNFYVPKPPPASQEMRRNAEKSSPPPQASSEHGSGLPEGDDPRPEPSALDDLTTFRVFGMTARIMVDAARVAYGEEPEFEHNSHFGDEDMIGRLLKMGRLSQVRKKGEVLTKDVLKHASKM
ncbi:8-oxo-dGTP diphosphatase [Ascochyta rabiei]|uniref:8-oxo-dGTP diphosphatase n=1 Tax=Didymella rabiei TaxID=5454 RepID=UPI00220A6DCE|nr:8-oxo-dGTP diphosphatase [Ascochyta rabiei]UPX11839.1 8-oxo-dGTP diphosphatase [Ascochyta rabiei]